MSAYPRHALLAEHEPSMVVRSCCDSTKPLLLVCEHAGVGVPESLSNAYPESLLSSHYGCDIGAGKLARALSERLQASAVLAHYSRLVIDANRRLDDPTLLLGTANGEPVAANIDLPAIDIDARIQDLYVPFHAAVEAELQRLTAVGPPPLYVAIHSFTPHLADQGRPWHVGVMWDQDEQTARHVINGLRAHDGIVVGDNQPYSGRASEDFSIDYHAERNGFANVALEIRQDLLATDSQVATWVARLLPLIESLLVRSETQTNDALAVREFRPDVLTFESAARQWLAS
ncbi:MAG: N-formylglutamate amidohydrolase [Pseudomonadota bacterium]